MRPWTDEEIEKYRNEELDKILARMSAKDVIELLMPTLPADKFINTFDVHGTMRSELLERFEQEITDALNDEFKDAASEEFDQKHLP